MGSWANSISWQPTVSSENGNLALHGIGVMVKGQLGVKGQMGVKAPWGEKGRETGKKGSNLCPPDGHPAVGLSCQRWQRWGPASSALAPPAACGCPSWRSDPPPPSHCPPEGRNTTIISLVQHPPPPSYCPPDGHNTTIISLVQHPPPPSSCPPDGHNTYINYVLINDFYHHCRCLFHYACIISVFQLQSGHFKNVHCYYQHITLHTGITWVVTTPVGVIITWAAVIWSSSRGCWWIVQSQKTNSWVFMLLFFLSHPKNIRMDYNTVLIYCLSVQLSENPQRYFLN